MGSGLLRGELEGINGAGAGSSSGTLEALLEGLVLGEDGGADGLAGEAHGALKVLDGDHGLGGLLLGGGVCGERGVVDKAEALGGGEDGSVSAEELLLLGPPDVVADGELDGALADLGEVGA